MSSNLTTGDGVTESGLERTSSALEDKLAVSSFDRLD